MRQLQGIVRIEIECPEQVGASGPAIGSLSIDDPQVIGSLISALQLRKSSREATSACKVPPGFLVRFISPAKTWEADVTMTGHKHILLRAQGEEEKIHFELLPAFEKAIRPYLLRSLEDDSAERDRRGPQA